MGIATGTCWLALSSLLAGDDLRLLDLDALPPAKRIRAQSERRAEFVKNAREQLEPGWRLHHKDDVAVFHHGVGQYAKDLAAELGSRRAWLENVWPFPGEDPCFSAPVVYIGLDLEEAEASRKASPYHDVFDGVGWTYEVPTQSGQKSNRFQFFGGDPASQESEVPKIRRAALEYWMFSADRHLAWAMPTWLYWGLVQGSQLYERKGSRFVLLDRWNWTIRQRVERRPPASVRDSWRAGSTPAFEVSEASSWIAFFRDGPGARKKSWKGLLEVYTGHVQTEVRAEEKLLPRAGVPADRRQEAAQLTAERARFEAMRDRIAQKAFDATFAGWSDADFTALDEAFLGFLLDD